MSENAQSLTPERSKGLLSMLMRFYSVMSNLPDEPGALSLMAEILASNGTDEQINIALSRCARECKYPVRLPDILQRIPGNEIPDHEAQARAGWDQAVSFAMKHVFSNSTDGHGVCVDSCTSRNCTERSAHYMDFHLPTQLRDTVRRVGGWRAIALAVHQPDPFLKKEFLAEWQAWRAVESAGAGLLKNPALKQLSGMKAIN